MKVTVIPNVIGALGTIPKEVVKGLVKGLENLVIKEREGSIQTTALLRSARIPRRLDETCFLSDSNVKPLANTAVKTSKTSYNNIII